ncbi:MAG TPA: hypothetical protein VF344_07535 [Candidatus Limnocylindrales bacterium]
MFHFSHHPTAISVSDGVQDAFQYLQKSWQTWLPVVGVVAACALVTHAIVGSLDINSLYHQDVITGRVVWNPDAWSKVSGALAARLVDAVLSGIAGWVFYATAIAGLRNRPVTLAGVVGRGLTTVLSGLIVAAAAIVLVTGLFLGAAAVAIGAPGIGRLLIVLLIVAAVPAAIYVVIRLIFTGLAIFDGFGPIGGIQESWRLSQGSVLRMLGWGALALLMTLGVSIIAGVIVAPFSGSRLAAVAEGAGAAVTLTGSCLVAFMMAVLYESERARKDPTLYPVPAWPGYGSFPAEPYDAGPYPARPYAPGPYTAGPYAGGPYPVNPSAPGWVPPGPYPADPTAVPGWTVPSGPAPAWPPPPYAGGPYPPNPSAGGWVMPGPAPAWAANPTDPAHPASLKPAGAGPDPRDVGNTDKTDPTGTPPGAPQPPETPAT